MHFFQFFDAILREAPLQNAMKALELARIALMRYLEDTSFRQRLKLLVGRGHGILIFLLLHDLPLFESGILGMSIYARSLRL